MTAQYFLSIIFFLVVHAFSCVAQSAFTLQECIDYALSHRHEVVISNLHAQNTFVDLNANRLLRLPSVQTQICNDLITEYEKEYEKTGEFDYSRANSYINQVTLEMSLPIWTEETNMNFTNSYKLKEKAAKFEADYMKLQVKLDVLDKYYTFVLTQIRYKIALEQTTLQDSSCMVTQNLFKIGKKAKKDVLDAQFNLEQDKYNAQIEQNNVVTALHNLAKCMNFEGILRIDTSIHVEEKLLINNIVDSVSEKHPYIAMESLKLLVAGRERKGIKREFFPSVYFNAVAGTSAEKNIGKDNISMEEQWKHNLYGRVGIDVKIPIFNHLSTKMKLQKNSIQINQNKENVAIAKEEVKYEIETIILDIRHEYETINRLSEMLILAKEEYQMAMTDYKLGNMASYELNVYKSKYISASLLLAQAKCQLEYKNAKLNIYFE